MKVFIVLCAVVVCASAHRSSLTAYKASFKAYKAQHGKAYHPSEESTRIERFAEKHAEIEAHNERFAAGLESFRMEHNRFSDRHPHELRSLVGDISPSEEQCRNMSLHEMSPGLGAPLAFDWRDNKGVTPVQDQDPCGCCYAFAAVGALESAYLIKNKKVLDLSEQNLIDCPDTLRCEGGIRHTVLAYAKDKGIVGDVNYPFEKKAGKCRHNPAQNLMKARDVVAIRAGDENAIRDAVATVGPVTAGFKVTKSFFNLKAGDVFKQPNCVAISAQEKQGGHAILIVGYGTQNKQDYWVIKNSWGAGWGDKGYFKMARGDNTCGIADSAVYPVL